MIKSIMEMQQNQENVSENQKRDSVAPKKKRNQAESPKKEEQRAQSQKEPILCEEAPMSCSSDSGQAMESSTNPSTLNNSQILQTVSFDSKETPKAEELPYAHLASHQHPPNENLLAMHLPHYQVHQQTHSIDDFLVDSPFLLQERSRVHFHYDDSASFSSKTTHQEHPIGHSELYLEEHYPTLGLDHFDNNTFDF